MRQETLAGCLRALLFAQAWVDGWRPGESAELRGVALLAVKQLLEPGFDQGLDELPGSFVPGLYRAPRVARQREATGPGVAGRRAATRSAQPARGGRPISPAWAARSCRTPARQAEALGAPSPCCPCRRAARSGGALGGRGRASPGPAGPARPARLAQPLRPEPVPVRAGAGDARGPSWRLPSVGDAAIARGARGSVAAGLPAAGCAVLRGAVAGIGNASAMDR